MKIKAKKYKAIMMVVISMFLLTACQNKIPAMNEEMEGNTEVVAEMNIEGIMYELPEGFIAHKDKKGMYVPIQNSEDSSYIFYQEQEADERLELLNEDNIKEQMTAIYSELYGKDTEVTVHDFHRVKIDGCKGIRVETEYSLGEEIVKSLEYVIVSTDKSYSISYVQIGNRTWWDDFLKSSETISIKQ